MPKLLDHGKKRDELAAATWRVILRDGIGGVSIRAIAREAGTSTGSLRHVFPSRVELLVHAMQSVDARATARLREHLTDPDPRRRVIDVIGEVLPLDEERRTEMEVNVALFAEAPADERIAAVRDTSHHHLHAACTGVIALLRDHRLTAPDIDTDITGAALHALIDGLALHLLIHRDADDRDRAWRIITTYLDGLAERPLIGRAEDTWPGFHPRAVVAGPQARNAS